MPVVPAARVTPLRPIQGVSVVRAQICKNKTLDAVLLEHTTLTSPLQLVQPLTSSNEAGNRSLLSPLDVNGWGRAAKANSGRVCRENNSMQMQKDRTRRDSNTGYLNSLVTRTGFASEAGLTI